MLTTLKSGHLVSFLFLTVFIGSMVSGLKLAIEGMDQAMWMPVCLFGLTAAFGMKNNQWPTKKSVAFLALAGLVFIFITSARIHESFLEAAMSLPRFEYSVISGILHGERIDKAILQDPLIEIGMRSSRLIHEIIRIPTGGSHAPMVREIYWDFPLFFLSTWAGWWTFRRNNPLVAVTPSIAMHSFVLYYANKEMFSLQVAIFALILLTGSTPKWVNPRDRAAPSPRAVRETFSSVVLLALVIAAGAGMIPSFSINSDMHGAANEGGLGRALGLRREIPTAYTTADLPRQHLVGLDPAASQSTVFTAKTGELPESDKEIITERIPRHYWRFLTFDVYDGHGWKSSPVINQTYQSYESLFDPRGSRYMIIHQKIEKFNPQDNRLFWTGTLYRATRSIEAAWRTSPDSLDPAVNPLLTADLLESHTEDQFYSADSLVPTFSAEELRGSSETYPAEISENYLSLPPSIPLRVLELANELTSDLGNPYDKARAIETFLRSFPYSLEVDPPPENMEVADYFLFDVKSGYCDYYATSMVVLSRAAGLPARLVIGYANGEYDPVKAVYIVREYHAHSWPEVYFGGAGWIEFEPTASQQQTFPPEFREKEEDPAFVEKNLRIRMIAYTKYGRFVRLSLIPTMLITATLGIIGLLVVLWRRGYFAGGRSITDIYHFLQLEGGRIRKSVPISETPSQFGKNLSIYLSMNNQWIRPARDEVEYIIHLYIREIFSPSPISSGELRQARRLWRRLFWRLAFVRMLRP